MQKLLFWIGAAILGGWILALVVNFSVYQEVTTYYMVIHPLVDGILFMAIMFGIYMLVWRTFLKKPQTATIQLASLGTVFMVLAFIV